MPEAFVQILCPKCEKDWQVTLDEVPEPGAEMTCDNCNTTRSVSEFTRTSRDFAILSEFYQ